ncbi:Six-hairpin glycosidase [Thozetella sp. PMI_491]|nr:Six-hairpin glycosidase [Thozetella sp. PMI_491]
MTATVTNGLSHAGDRATSGHLETKGVPQEDASAARNQQPRTTLFSKLYSENVTAKILRLAESCLQNNNPPSLYPELVPQSGLTEGQYNLRARDFWTCGFFPGSIYLLLERTIKYPGSMRHGDSQLLSADVRDKLEVLAKTWSEPLHRAAHRTDTHDLGFMIMPHMRPRWELLHDRGALQSICTAASSLYSRFDARVGAIRSWDSLTWQKNVNIQSKMENFLVIIDSLCNLDLLFYAAAHTGYSHLAEAADTHARTLLRTHLRPEPERRRDGYDGLLYSTCHVVNFLPTTGEIKEIRTAQGYAPSSTWSRGQAWAIMGYAQTFAWTGEQIFLDAACGLAEYFMLRLEDAPGCVEIIGTDSDGFTRAGRYVPLWDFDAPIEDMKAPRRDVSAGVAAANGMLILAQALMARGLHTRANRYRDGALNIVQDTLSLSLSREQARLHSVPNGGVSVESANPELKTFDSILRDSTVAWNEHNLARSAEHGLIYADYYLIEFGNRLLQLGYVRLQNSL